MEIWKQIPNYEGLYEASSWGRIRSLPRNGRKGRILKQYTSKSNGYRYVSLCKNNKAITKRVHVLVAKSFIEQTAPQVNHIDGNKTNNRIENLEWCTASENMLHAYREKLEKHYGKKVICLDTLEIFDSGTECIRSIFGTNVSPNAIFRVCKGERSHYKGWHFAFLEDYENNTIPKYKGKYKKEEPRVDYTKNRIATREG